MSIAAPKYCQCLFPNASVDPANNNYSFPSRARQECISISPKSGEDVSIQSELAKARMTFDFDTLINVTLNFKVTCAELFDEC